MIADNKLINSEHIYFKCSEKVVNLWIKQLLQIVV